MWYVTCGIPVSHSCCMRSLPARWWMGCPTAVCSRRLKPWWLPLTMISFRGWCQKNGVPKLGVEKWGAKLPDSLPWGAVRLKMRYRTLRQSQISSSLRSLNEIRKSDTQLDTKAQPRPGRCRRRQSIPSRILRWTWKRPCSEVNGASKKKSWRFWGIFWDKDRVLDGIHMIFMVFGSVFEIILLTTGEGLDVFVWVSSWIFEWMIAERFQWFLFWGYPPSTFGSWWRLDLSRRSTKICLTKSCPRSWSFTGYEPQNQWNLWQIGDIDSDSAEYQQTLFSIMMHKADFINHIWYGI